jgi:hypothetical protein
MVEAVVAALVVLGPTHQVAALEVMAELVLAVQFLVHLLPMLVAVVVALAVVAAQDRLEEAMALEILALVVLRQQQTLALVVEQVVVAGTTAGVMADQEL